jgi:hypothetical protein
MRPMTSGLSAPQSKPEQDYEDACEVRADLVVDPGLAAVIAPRSEMSSFATLYADGCARPPRDPSDVECHERDEAANRGEARRHV